MELALKPTLLSPEKDKAIKIPIPKKKQACFHFMR
jgi:hypothetical protein